MRAFNRAWLLTIDRYLIRPRIGYFNLDIDFSVEKDTSRTPNKCSLKVFNFGHDLARSLPANPQIQLNAGYEDYHSTIYSGQAERVYYHMDGVDSVLEIESKDSGASYRGSVSSRSFGPNTTVLDVLKYGLDSMGIGYGNLQSVMSDIKTSDGNSVFVDGFVAHGRAREIVNTIIVSSGFRWSIQDGAIQIRSGDEPVQRHAVVLGPGRGLIGSPSKDTTGKVLARSNLTPAIYPGRVVIIDSSEVEGNYSVQKVQYTGKSYAQDWYCDMTLVSY
jgi:hypothetical protein